MIDKKNDQAIEQLEGGRLKENDDGSQTFLPEMRRGGGGG
jgi:hypothetical protein